MNKTHDIEPSSTDMRNDNKKAYDIVVYGHCAHDIIFMDGKKEERLGGSPSYIYEILKNLDIDFRIVTKVGKDFKYHEQLGFTPLITDKPTTEFHNIYSGKDRIQKSPHECEKIFAGDVIPARIAIVTGITCEVPPETLSEIRKKSETVIVDIQSIIRERDKNNNIYEIPIEDTQYIDILGKVDYITCNEKEFKFINSKKIPSIKILTQGRNGCTMIERDNSVIVPTNPIEEGDSTGCGDMFIAGFAYALLKGRSLLECAQAANVTGALALRDIGVPKIRKEWLTEVL